MPKAIMEKDAKDNEREEKLVDALGSPIKKARDWVGLLVAALPLIGALGTLFVWIFASLYVGNVEVKITQPYRAILVQVFNEKGSENEFRSPRFQLMPGDYLLRVTLDSQAPKNLRAIVKYKETTLLPYDENLPSAQVRADEEEEKAIEVKANKKRWWQFWRK